jgi:hypothetical protein
MKTLFQTLTVVFLLTSASAFASPVNPPPIARVVDSHQQNFFAFKVDRTFKNALIEVYSRGELVAVTAMSKRKMVINFSDVKSGNYIIKVKKNNRVEEFHFEKK